MPMRQVSAQAILDTAFRPPDLSAVSPDQFIERTRTIYTRSNSPVAGRTDPYHKALSDTVIQTTWIAGQAQASRIETRDADTNDLLSLTLSNPDRIHTLLPLQGIVVEQTSPARGESAPGASTAVPPKDNPPAETLTGASMSRLPASDWGGEGWLITQTHRQQMPIEVSGLSLSVIEQRWVVDAASNQLIQTEEWGTTSSGERILLRRISDSRPRTGRLSELPPDWFAVPTGTQSATSSNFQVSPESQEELRPIAERPLLPSSAIANSLTKAQVTDGMLFAPGNSIVFDIRTAAANGLAIEHVYQNEDKVVTVIQGPRETLTRAMKTLSVATYDTSAPIDLTINGASVRAWIATGGTFDAGPAKQIVLMFETEDRFVYIIGQGTSEEELTAFANSLTS
jgi:hypothetical protein